MTNEILSELVTLRQLYEGGYVQQHYVESYFVIFNDEGNRLFDQLTNLKKFKEKELQLVYESFGFIANNTPKEYYGLYWWDRKIILWYNTFMQTIWYYKL